MAAREMELSVADLRDQAFLALRAAMPAPNMEEALRCSARLKAALPQSGQLDRNLVLVAYGGGKDSSYTLAFVRVMQLILFRIYGATFRLRVATNRHAGMPRAVLENVDREYQALRLYGDPDCELLLIDGNEVTPFDVDSPQREHVVRRNRLDILMTGHRTFGDGRPTFCNACNLSVFSSFGLAAAYGEGADLIITGDSKEEQREYTIWVGRLSRRLAAVGKAGQVTWGNRDTKTGQAGRGNGSTGAGHPARGNGDAKASQAARGNGSTRDGQAGQGTAGTKGGQAVQGSGLGRLLSHLDRIAQSYFTDIHGPDATEILAERRVTTDVPDRLQFFSVYSDTGYAAGDHMEMLTGFLGFEFDDLAFSFTESDCGNPALMAHLRALKCERVFRRSYAEGLAEYVEFALGLMRKKDFPAELIEQMRARYDGPDAAARMRRAADDYAREAFGLTEQQLICMAYSPFAEKGAGLAEFLGREHAALADRADDIHTLLAGQAFDDEALAGELERMSGLGLPQLRLLYGSPVRRLGGGGSGGDGGSGGTDVIDAVLEGDPHKAVIRTRHAPDGPDTLEQISGR